MHVKRKWAGDWPGPGVGTECVLMISFWSDRKVL